MAFIPDFDMTPFFIFCKFEFIFVSTWLFLFSKAA